MAPRQPIKIDRSPRVLVATDLGSRSEAAIARAHAIAQGLGAQLLLAHVVDLAKSARAVGRRRTRARLALDAQSSKLARWGSEVQTSVRTGRPHEVIADLAIEWDADLVVLGPYRRSPATEAAPPHRFPGGSVSVAALDEVATVADGLQRVQ